MASIKDQVGAMAVIDSLRLEQMQILENLDLPKRREAVAAKIREYYSTSGVVVDDALVEQGVKKYFDARLRFVEPEVSTLQRRLADTFMYLEESFRLRKSDMALSALVAFLVVGGVSYAPTFIEGVQNDLYKQEILVPVEKLKSDVNRNLAALDVLLSHPATKQSTMLAQMGANVKAGYESINEGLGSSPWFEASSEDPDSIDRSKSDFYKSRFHPFEDQYAQLGRDAGRFESLVYAYSNFIPLTQPGTIESLGYLNNRLSALKRASDLVVSSFGSDEQPSELVVQQLFEDLSFFDSFKQRIPDLERIFRDFDEMGKETYDQPEVTRLMIVLSNAIDKRDGWEASRAVSNLDSALTFAKEPLTFRIISRPGEKSGVIRTPNDFADSKGVPYLIVEALDASGRPFEVSIMDSEVGEIRRAHTFGVRVTHEQFEQVKQDKMDDGLIENNLIGQKAVNSFKINFDSRVTSENKMITRW